MKLTQYFQTKPLAMSDDQFQTETNSSQLSDLSPGRKSLNRYGFSSLVLNEDENRNSYKTSTLWQSLKYPSLTCLVGDSKIPIPKFETERENALSAAKSDTDRKVWGNTKKLKFIVNELQP